MNNEHDGPRIVLDFPNADYHAHPSLSKSGLDRIARSPFHYWADYLNPARPQREETLAMKMGTLAHTAVLEPAEMNNRYIVKPADLDLRTKEGKAWAATTGDKIVLTQDQHDAAIRMRASLMALPDVAAALSVGHAEVSAFWTDERTGVACKCRPDWVHPVRDDAVIIVDVKTTQDASPGEFARSAAKYRYHVQNSFYTDGYSTAANVAVIGFVFAVVESSYPFAAACYMLDEEAIDAGRDEYRECLDLYRSCREKNVWPAFGGDMQLLALPGWALK